MKVRIVVLMIYFSAFLTMAGDVKAQSGADLFKQYCTACHTIGNGDLIGPDLSGVTDKRDQAWLIQFIQSSQTMIKNGNPEAEKVFEEYNKIPMPDQPLNDSETKKVLEYISSQTSPASTPETSTQLNQIEQSGNFQYTSADVKTGLALFKGKQPLSKGGASCISCHTVKHDAVIAGGTMARNLTPSYKNLGVQGIQAILSSPPFPAMSASYREHSLTKEEVHALSAFLVDASKESIYQHPREYTKYFILIGLFFWIILISIIALIWMRRKRGSVNDAIYNRQIEIH